MRSQSNLSLTKREVSNKDANPSSTSRLSTIKSPDLSCKASSLCDPSTGRLLKSKVFNLFDRGKENIPHNSSLSLLSNYNHIPSSTVPLRNLVASTKPNHKKFLKSQFSLKEYSMTSTFDNEESEEKCVECRKCTKKEREIRVAMVQMVEKLQFCMRQLMQKEGRLEEAMERVRMLEKENENMREMIEKEGKKEDEKRVEEEKKK